jgi:hypothetical protein
MKLTDPVVAFLENYKSEGFHQFTLAFTFQIARVLPNFDEAYAYCETVLSKVRRRPLQPAELTNALAGAYERIGRDEDGRGPRRGTLKLTGDGL